MMLKWKNCFIIAILVTIFNHSDCKVITKPELSEDETVNINIRNGAGLKISYPAGEIIVPSERKNVRIKTIDVFEEKNSLPQSPPTPPDPPKQDNRHIPNYFSSDFSKPGSPYKWQLNFPQNELFSSQKRMFAPLLGRKGRPNYFQISDDEVFDSDEDITSFTNDQYEYYDDFPTKQRPYKNKNKSKQMQTMPSFKLEFFLDLLQQVVIIGRCLLKDRPYIPFQAFAVFLKLYDHFTVAMQRIKTFFNILGAEFVNFARGTTIHGVPILAAKKLHPLERLFWAIIITFAALAAWQLSTQNVGRYYANPTVVSIQKDYRNWFNPFPSATACFANKVDEILADEYIIETWGLNESDRKYDYYREFVIAIANASYASLDMLEKFAQDPELNRVDLFELAAKVHPELTGNLVTFDTQRKTDWHLVMTELGICFSVNTKVAKYFKYKVTGLNTTLTGANDDNKHILQCHYLNGLCYARYDSDPLLPLKIYVHSFLDIAHATSDDPLHVKESQELEINFKMQQTSANRNLRTLTPAQRKCRFDDEPLNKQMPAYSTSICYIMCRYRLVMKLCGCRPFFYHNFGGKVCDLAGLVCVAKHSGNITKPPIELGCKCPPPCDFIQYLPQVPKITMWEYGYFDQRLTFRWGLLPPTTKFHREIIFGFEDLIVSIGGTAALFLGVSFITAMEIIFFVLNLISTVIMPRRNNHRLNKIVAPDNIKVIKWNSRSRSISKNNSKKNEAPQKINNRGSRFIPYLD